MCTCCSRRRKLLKLLQEIVVFHYSAYCQDSMEKHQVIKNSLQFILLLNSIQINLLHNLLLNHNNLQLLDMRNWFWENFRIESIVNYGKKIPTKLHTLQVFGMSYVLKKYILRFFLLNMFNMTQFISSFMMLELTIFCSIFIVVLFEEANMIPFHLKFSRKLCSFDVSTIKKLLSAIWRDQEIIQLMTW